MLTKIKNAIAICPEDGMIYLVKELSSVSGFFMVDKKLLYLVENFENASSNSIVTDYVRMNTAVQINAVKGTNTFKSGKYNILELENSHLTDQELCTFVDLCDAHTKYLRCEDFQKFFYSIINIFQLPSDKAYKNLLGLFAELSLIKHVYLKKKYDLSSAWHKTGSFDKYDFVLDNFNLEVKSTSTENTDVTIKHAQLFNDDNNYLVKITIEPNNSGYSLNSLVDELKSSEDYCNNYNFIVNVEKELRRVSPVDAENLKFSVLNIDIYNADDINPLKSIPDNIYGIEYKLDLSMSKVTLLNDLFF